MPARLAFLRTASSSSSEIRRLSDFCFGLNSKRIGLNCEKSRSDKSCSRKASASSSVLNLGTFLFIAFDLLAVHVARANRTDEKVTISLANCEYHEHRLSPRVAANGDEPLLDPRMLMVKNAYGRAPPAAFLSTTSRFHSAARHASGTSLGCPRP